MVQKPYKSPLFDLFVYLLNKKLSFENIDTGLEAIDQKLLELI